MAKRKLRLVKKNKKLLESQQPMALTSVESPEAARFRAMTAARAARQMMLQRIMAEVTDLEDISNAA